jgi:hypothetical protein
MPIQKRKKPKVECKFCQFFADGERVGKFDRYCTPTHTVKDKSDESCDFFILTKLFWCIKRNAQIEPKVCANIRKCKREGKGGKTLSPEHFSSVYAACIIGCSEGKTIEALFSEPIKTNIIRRQK